MERTSSIRKKTLARQHKAEVMIAGEQLRLKLHDGKLIKERRYHLRTYPNCFVGQELIDWLLSHKEAPDRTTAVCLMQHLMDHDIVHHVCDKYSIFKDAKRLYRFRKDDGTFPFNTEVKIFMRGQQLYEQLIGEKNSILQLREEHGVTYQRAFPGCQFIDWIIQNGEAESRRRGLDLCRALQEHGIIQHVSKKHDFFDSGLLYQFCINFRRRRRLSELLNDAEQNTEEGGVLSKEENHHQDSPFLVCKHSLHDEHSGFQSVGLRKEIKSVTSGRRGSLNSLKIRSDFPSFTPLSSISTVQCNPKSVLSRNFTCEELLAPGAPFIKKVLTLTDLTSAFTMDQTWMTEGLHRQIIMTKTSVCEVIGDALGWGFVVRGTAPCYIQAVDPGSPAAAAGIKVRQFVCQVNGQFVLYMDYRTVTKLVMTGTRTVVVEVMEPLEE